MRRRALKVLSALSLAVCVAVLATMPISYRYAGMFHRTYMEEKPDHRRVRRIDLRVGRGEVTIDDQLLDTRAPPPMPQNSSPEAMFTYRQIRNHWMMYGAAYRAEIQYQNKRRTLVPIKKVPPIFFAVNSRLGFAFDLDHDKGRPSYELRIALPLWSFAIPPAIMAIILRPRGKRDPLKCAKCGYDLRATPSRCPECGTVPSAISPVSYR